MLAFIADWLNGRLSLNTSNSSLQPTVTPLRGLPSAELKR